MIPHDWDWVPDLQDCQIALIAGPHVQQNFLEVVEENTRTEVQQV